MKYAHLALLMSALTITSGCQITSEAYGKVIETTNGSIPPDMG